MKEWNKRYLIQFWGGMIGYLILLPASLFLLGMEVVVGNGRYLIAVLPVLPFAVAMHATVSNIRKLDELQRQIHFEAVVIALLLTGGITFTYGLLESNKLVPHLPAVLIAPIMIALWGIALAFVRRKYA